MVFNFALKMLNRTEAIGNVLMGHGCTGHVRQAPSASSTTLKKSLAVSPELPLYHKVRALMQQPPFPLQQAVLRHLSVRSLLLLQQRGTHARPMVFNLAPFTCPLMRERDIGNASTVNGFTVHAPPGQYAANDIATG